MPEAYLISAARSPLVIPPAGELPSAGQASAAGGLISAQVEQALRSGGVRPEKVDAVYWAGDERSSVFLRGKGWGPLIGVQAGELSAHVALHLAAQAILAGDLNVALVAAANTAGQRPKARLPLRDAQGWASRHKLTRAALDEAARRALASAAQVAVDGTDAPAARSVPLEPAQTTRRANASHFHPEALASGVVLLASPSAVGALNLAPRAALSARSLASAQPGPAWEAVFSATRKALTAMNEAAEAIERACIAAPFVGVELAWQRRFNVPAERLLPLSAVYGPATGLIALLDLVDSLEQSHTRLGLLASAGSGAAAATLVERI